MEAEKLTDNQQYLPITRDAWKAPKENFVRLQATVKLISFFDVREYMPYIEFPEKSFTKS